MNRGRLLGISVVFALNAVSVSRAQPRASAIGSAPTWSDSLKSAGRHAPPLRLAPLWMRRGQLDDTVLAKPGAMFADSLMLLVIDYSPASVVLFDATTGKLVRVIGKVGRGPGEWIGPLSIIGRRGREIGVYDSGLRRMTWIASSNASLRQEAIRGVSLSANACALSDDTNLYSFMARANATQIARSTSGSSTAITTELPWLSLRQETHVVSQVQLAQTNEGCLVFSRFATGLARYDRAGMLLDTIGLIETIPVPKVVVEKVARGTSYGLASGIPQGVIGAARLGSYLVVAFGGRTKQRDRLLDFYDWTTGKYVGSLKTAYEINAIAATSSTLYLPMEDEDGLYVLQALRAAGDTPKR